MRKTFIRHWKDQDDGTLRKGRISIDIDKILDVAEYPYDQFDKQTSKQLLWI